MATHRAHTRVLDLDKVRAHTLPNGLRVRLLPDRSAPTASYYTFFQVGSRNERLGTTGISHLFEHMMFNGAAKYGPKEFDRVLESRGGHSNAYTSNDVTAYYEDFAPDALETVIDLEADRMRSLRLTAESLEQEREVVKEERRLRTENSIFGLMEEQLEALVFLAHPYRWPVIGWMDDIERITRDDCEAFFRTYYAPNNAAIYVVGDLDPDATLALIEGHYADISAGPRPAPVAQGEPPQRGERRAVVRYPAQAPALLAGWRGPAARSPDSAALDVLQVCLAVGESSRLRRRLVQDEEVAVSVSIGWGWRIDPGVFLAFLELAPKVKSARAEAMLWEEIDEVATKGVATAEVRRAQALLRSSVLHELATHHGVAHALGQAEALLGDWREAARALEHYAAVGPRDVKRVAAEYLDPARRCVVALDPEVKR
ncbi:pitrilysin family protein [Anaeromyxobacter sp. Fw109-5]|uniref:M16 family metallopeptidase n=1 Tax=Anaeromyxobacter sp. (strain Fw109-5) TaxID=404589 RepID=UPI0000ED81A7|nr:peptidase M16 domain protein [Anaeromyxobacter sp. Fw109-5]